VSADLDEPDDEDDLGDDEGATNCWLYTAIIGIETPEGECTTDPSFDLEIEFDHFPTDDERAAQVLDEGAPWLAFYLSSKSFVDRFGDNPPLCAIGETIQRC
jgi:hypothetical protein